MEFPARYAPLCEAQSFPKWKVRGTQHLQTAQMGRNEPFGKNGLGFAKTIFWGKGFAKPRLMFLKFGGILDFARAEKGVWGMNPRGLQLFVFGGAGK